MLLPGLEFDISKPWLKGGIFRWVYLLNGFFFFLSSGYLQGDIIT